MIDFLDHHFGRIVLYGVGEYLSFPTLASPIEDVDIDMLRLMSEADVVAVRNELTKEVTLVKNRFGEIDSEYMKSYLSQRKVQEHELYQKVEKPLDKPEICDIIPDILERFLLMDFD